MKKMGKPSSRNITNETIRKIGESNIRKMKANKRLSIIIK